MSVLYIVLIKYRLSIVRVKICPQSVKFCF
nr:MAG TPA_asm: hypothetical protein [Caudoviricetes sp.]